MERIMSFDLRIRFAGLMMWVPEGQTGMHVLLPSTVGHAHGAHGNGRGGVHAHEYKPGTVPPRAPGRPRSIPPRSGGGAMADAASGVGFAAAEASSMPMPMHHARVMYDAAYEQPGATQLTRTYVLVDLSNGVLDLAGLPTDNGIFMHLPDEIPSLATIAEPVPRELVRGAPDARLAGRVSMDAGGLTFYELNAAFSPPGQQPPQRMTAGTEWTIRGIRSRKDASLGGVEFLPGRTIQGADGAEVGRLPDLYPIADTIHLTVFHVVASQFPPKGTAFALEAGEDDPHFGAYFGICPPRIHDDLTARKVAGIPVAVRGPKPSGEELPGAICVQSKNVLGA
jgi:hypothetical protein